MARTYTPSFRAQALAQLELNGGALRATARQVDVPAPTLQQWRDSMGMELCTIRTIAVQEKPDYLDLIGECLRVGLNLLRDRLPAMAPRDLAVATGIMADKFLDYRDGRRGMAVNIDARSQHLSLPASLTIEELKALAAGAEA